MRLSTATLSLAALTALAAVGGIAPGLSAQEATPSAPAAHPFVGTWVVDTVSATDADSPEIAVVTPDGGLVGLGANRVAGGTWEAVDGRTAMLTLVTVFDDPAGAGYVVVRGPHTVDATGDAWTCECTFTVVGTDGTVLDSGDAPATARRLPQQGPDLTGQALAEVPAWVSALAATPAP